MTTTIHSRDSEIIELLRGVHISNITGLSIIQQCTNAASSNIAAVATAANTGSVLDNVDDEYGTNMEMRNNDKLLHWVRPLLNARKQKLV